MAIRVPKGVTIDGKGWGGRFVSRAQLIDLAGATEGTGLRAIERLAEREYRKAANAHQRAADRYVEAPERYRERRQVAQLQQQEWERVKDAVEDFKPTTPAPAPRPTRRSAPSRKGAGVPKKSAPQARSRKASLAGSRGGKKGAPGKRAPERKAPARTKPRGASEWEIGFKYRTDRRGKRSSDVDVNLRIRRVDGRPFALATAQKVLAHVRQTQETPDGYMVAGVDWKRPYAGTGWRHGDVGDMENFWAPMFSRDRDTKAWSVTAAEFRYGAVKQGGDDDDDDGE